MSDQGTATASKSAPPAVTGFIPVSVGALKALPRVDIDLFFLPEGGVAPVLYKSSGFVSDDENLARFEGACGNTLYVKAGDFNRFQHCLDDSLETILRNDDVEVADRFGIFQWAVAVHIERAFRMIRCDRAVQQSKQIGSQITQLLRGTDTLPSDLFRIMRHDYHTFTHVTNVASYSVLLAERLGIRDEQDLEAIAVGALLHDLGKRLIPKSILTKRGPLTDEEFDVVRGHPQRGYEELHDRDDLKFGQLMMVYQHHERIDGRGYPARVAGKEIHSWARLCAVVDVFDAMTGKRPYREPLEVSEVLEYLQTVAGSHLDKEMVQCWTEAMSTN